MQTVCKLYEQSLPGRFFRKAVVVSSNALLLRKKVQPHRDVFAEQFFGTRHREQVRVFQHIMQQCRADDARVSYPNLVNENQGDGPRMLKVTLAGLSLLHTVSIFTEVVRSINKLNLARIQMGKPVEKGFPVLCRL